jgi:hypothetical protein
MSNADTIIPAQPGWRLCVDTDGDGFPRRPFCQIDILAWAIAPNGKATAITPHGRANMCGAVIGQPTGNITCGFVVMNGPILRDHGEVERWFQIQRQQKRVA